MTRAWAKLPELEQPILAIYCYYPAGWPIRVVQSVYLHTMRLIYMSLVFQMVWGVISNLSAFWMIERRCDCLYSISKNRENEQARADYSGHPIFSDSPNTTRVWTESDIYIINT